MNAEFSTLLPSYGDVTVGILVGPCPRGVAFSPNNHKLAVTRFGETILWDLPTMKSWKLDGYVHGNNSFVTSNVLVTHQGWKRLYDGQNEALQWDLSKLE